MSGVPKKEQMSRNKTQKVCLDQRGKSSEFTFYASEISRARQERKKCCE
jgi:hypothetical protein